MGLGFGLGWRIRAPDFGSTSFYILFYLPLDSWGEDFHFEKTKNVSYSSLKILIHFWWGLICRRQEIHTVSEGVKETKNIIPTSRSSYIILDMITDIFS